MHLLTELSLVSTCTKNTLSQRINMSLSATKADVEIAAAVVLVNWESIQNKDWESHIRHVTIASLCKVGARKFASITTVNRK